VTILSDRWHGLRNVPHVRLCRLPTPVEPLPQLSAHAGAELWIKRDDQSAEHYGGNKVRKLEYLLGDALSRKADTLVTAGAAGSHHALATTLYGADLGFQTHAVLMPQRYGVHAEENLRALQIAGAHAHPVGGGAGIVPRMTALAASLRVRGRHPYLIPPGGSNVAGVIGYVEAGLELARQLEAGQMLEPDAIFVPLGTGGTLSGLAIGLAAGGVTTPIYGVRVVPRSLAHPALIASLIKRTVKHLRRLDARFPDVTKLARAQVEIDHGEAGQGYGVPSSAGRSALRLVRDHVGIELDDTYTAKTFASVLRHASGAHAKRRLLYWHTLSSAPIDSRVRNAPPLPSSLRRLLRR